MRVLSSSRALCPFCAEAIDVLDLRPAVVILRHTILEEIILAHTDTLLIELVLLLSIVAIFILLLGSTLDVYCFHSHIHFHSLISFVLRFSLFSTTISPSPPKRWKCAPRLA